MKIEDPTAKFKTRIPHPVKHPTGAGAFPSTAGPPKMKPINTRIYTKQAAKQDPTQFMGPGFGMLGMTGES